MLKMKPHCERCAASTGHREKAYICSFECTFCAPCAQTMRCVCPNCAGDLMVRPTRTVAPVTALWRQLRRKWLG